MKAHLVLFSIALLLGTVQAVGLQCWQCNSLDKPCEEWKQYCDEQSYDTLGLPDYFAPALEFDPLEEPRGTPKMNCVTFPNALSCYQCRGANGVCEKLRDVPLVSCQSLVYEQNPQDGYSDTFKPAFDAPKAKGFNYMCVHFAYDIQTYRGCMLTTKEKLSAECDILKKKYSKVNENYVCNYCEEDNCNSGITRITGHPFALLIASVLFVKGILLH